MDAGIKETKEQALKEMELFKTVFDGVRLLNMHALELIGKGLGSYSLTESEQQFDFWEKYDEDHTVIRFATSWGTKMEDIDALIELL